MKVSSMRLGEKKKKNAKYHIEFIFNRWSLSLSLSFETLCSKENRIWMTTRTTYHVITNCDKRKVWANIDKNAPFQNSSFSTKEKNIFNFFTRCSMIEFQSPSETVRLELIISKSLESRANNFVFLISSSVLFPLHSIWRSLFWTCCSWQVCLPNHEWLFLGNREWSRHHDGDSKWSSK